MALDTLATLNAILVETWQPIMARLVSTARPVLSVLETKERKTVKIGRGLYVLNAVEIAPPQGIGARNDNEDYPDVAPGTYATGYNTAKFLSFVHEFTLDAITALSSGSQDENGMTLDEIITGLVQEYSRDKARQVLGDGSGILAQVNGAVANSVTVAYDNARQGFPLFVEGMKLECRQYSTSTTPQITNMFISTINENWDAGTGTITLSAVATMTDNYYLFREGNANREIIGFLAAFDDGTYTNTYNSISLSTYQRWQGNCYGNGGVLRACTEELLAQIWRGPKKYGMKPTVAFCNGIGFDKIGILLAAKFQYAIPIDTNSAINVPGGITGLKFQGVNVLEEEQCMRNMLFTYADDKVKLFVPQGMAAGFEKGDGVGTAGSQVLLDSYSTTTGRIKPAKHIVFREWVQLNAYNRRAGGVGRDIDWSL